MTLTYEQLESRCQWLEWENEKLKKEIENLIWNLAGCDVYALGYDTDKPIAEEFARPALKTVLDLRLKYDALRKAIAWFFDDLSVAPLVNLTNLRTGDRAKHAQTLLNVLEEEK